jgi:hypothetical protein
MVPPRLPPRNGTLIPARLLRHGCAVTAPTGSFDLRHTVATLAYRAEKVLREAPRDLADFRVSPRSRSGLALVAHLGDLLEWGVRMASGAPTWEAVPQASWDDAVERFFRGLAALDAVLAAEAVPGARQAMLFQGPIADALSHVGQLAMMRGALGSAVRPESYARARITAGRVGRDQDAKRVEFDDDASPQPGS